MLNLFCRKEPDPTDFSGTGNMSSFAEALNIPLAAIPKRRRFLNGFVCVQESTPLRFVITKLYHEKTPEKRGSQSVLKQFDRENGRLLKIINDYLSFSWNFM